jgi:hypothetical protein
VAYANRLVVGEQVPFGPKGAVAVFGDFEMRIGGIGDALEFALGFEAGDEATEVVLDSSRVRIYTYFVAYYHAIAKGLENV